MEVAVTGTDEHIFHSSHCLIFVKNRTFQKLAVLILQDILYNIWF